jgi:hypothetical protein
MSTETKTPTNAQVILQIRQAERIVSALDQKKISWTMSIPPRHDVDPDIIIGNALQMASREIARLEAWVDDLQSGMFINCVYCGHRYGPKENVPATMADVLKDHVEVCPEHPMSALRSDYDRLVKLLMKTSADLHGIMMRLVEGPNGTKH